MSNHTKNVSEKAFQDSFVKELQKYKWQAPAFLDDNDRHTHQDVTREKITLTIFKKAQVRGGDSSYKIAREVESANGNRLDLILLINDLPLINIEQKRADKSLEEAYNQFKRYYAD